MLRCLYLICFILFVGHSFGMQVKPVKAVKPKLVLHYDSTKVQTRGFNNTALKNFGKQPEFQYKGSYTGPSLWHLLWTWVWDMIERFLLKGNSGSFFFGFLKYFFILLGASAVAFLILRLSGVDALNIFRGKPISAGLSHSESLENIHEIDFDADIEKAVAQRNYRFAVRLLYLKCLKHLSDTGQIHWEINKTNSTYISELANLEQRIAFNLLTRQFEYIWYGEFMIDAPVFTKVNALFNDFKAKAA